MTTSKIRLEEIKLIGIALDGTTRNKDGQSGIDCGKLWQKFEKENIAMRIPNKLDDEVLAVYHQYQGNHEHPFSYFIGCKVGPGSKIPEGLNGLIISKGNYQKIKSTGKMPDCVANTWKEIWKSNIPRAYQEDFEIYNEKSRDWNNAEVELYISIK